jgi:hypothetical protein
MTNDFALCLSTNASGGYLAPLDMQICII